MRLWVQAGIPALDVLRAATLNSANLLGRPDLGRLQPGARANVILLDADPTLDMGYLSSANNRLLMKGNWVDRNKLKTLVAGYTERHLALS
jgi:imidazolonepropionase-like amidohydrolase